VGVPMGLEDLWERYQVLEMDGKPVQFGPFKAKPQTCYWLTSNCNLLGFDQAELAIMKSHAVKL